MYDPGLSILGRPSFAFFEPFEKAVDAGEYARAMTVMARGVYPDDPAAKLPFGVALQITRAFMHTPVGRRLADLLPTTPPEIRRIHDHDGPATDYAGITAEVLLAAGSGSPAYFAENCRAVADAIPRGRAIVIPRASHNAANIARDRFVEPFANVLRRHTRDGQGGIRSSPSAVMSMAQAPAHSGAEISPRYLPTAGLRLEGGARVEHRYTHRVDGAERGDGVLPGPTLGGHHDDARRIGGLRGDGQGERRDPGPQHPARPALEPQQQTQALETDQVSIPGAARQQDRTDRSWRWGKQSPVVEPGPDRLGGHDVLGRVVATRRHQPA